MIQIGGSQMKRTLASILASAMMLFALAGCAGGNAPTEMVIGSVA